MTLFLPVLRARLLLALLLGASPLGALPAAAALQHGGCSISSLADGAFSACFPASPAAATSPAGPGGRTRIWSAEFHHGLYLALEAPLAGDASAAAARLVARLDGRMVAAKPGTFPGGMPALRFWFALDAKREGKGIFVLRGGRLYGLLTVTAAKDAAMAARFLASLAAPASAKAAEALPGRASDKPPPSLSPGARAMGERIAMALLSTNGSPGSSSSADSNAPGAELQPVVPGADIFYPDVESRPGAYLANLQNFESGGNPNAVNTKSSAVGPYQFTNDTWNDVWSRSLKDRGIVNDPTDPTAAALGADAYTKENAATLTKALGRTPTDSELATAHVFGPMGATRLLEGNLYQPATDFASPQVVSANSLLFYNADGTSKTVGELKGLFDRHFGTGNTALAGSVEAPQALMGAGQALQMARALMFPNGQLFLAGFEMAKPYLAMAEKMLPTGYYIGADYDIHASPEYLQGEASIGGAKRVAELPSTISDARARGVLAVGGRPGFQNRVQISGVNAQAQPTTSSLTPAMPNGNSGSGGTSGQNTYVTGLSPLQKSSQEKRGAELADDGARLDQNAANAKQNNILPDQMRRESASRDMVKFANFAGDGRAYASTPTDLSAARSPQAAAASRPQPQRIALADITAADGIPDPHADLGDPPPRNPELREQTRALRIAPPANAPAAPLSTAPRAKLDITRADDIPDPHADLGDPPGNPESREHTRPLAIAPPANAPPAPLSTTPRANLALEPPPPPPADETVTPLPPRPALIRRPEASVTASSPPAHRIWRPGGWRWSGYDWEWLPGRGDWAEASVTASSPLAHRIWRPGAWRWSGYGWEWLPGRWDWART